MRPFEFFNLTSTFLGGICFIMEDNKSHVEP